MNIRNLFIVIVVVALASLSFWGYKLSTRPIPVTFASGKGSTEGFLTDIIKAYGIDKKHGIDLIVEKFAALDAYKAVEERKVNAGMVPPFPAAKFQLAGKDIVMFAPMRWNVTSLIVHSDSPYRTLEDLKEKTIGVTPCNSSFYIDALLTFKARGLDFKKDFKLVEGKVDEIVARFENKEIEAVVLLAEPRVSKMLAGGKVREIVKLRDLWREATGDYAPCHAVASYNDWIDANPKTAKNLANTFIDAIQFLQTHPEIFVEQKAALKEMGIETEAEIAQFRAMIPTIYPSRWDETTVRNNELYLQKAKEAGLIDSVPPVTRVLK